MPQKNPERPPAAREAKKPGNSRGRSPAQERREKSNWKVLAKCGFGGDPWGPTGVFSTAAGESILPGPVLLGFAPLGYANPPAKDRCRASLSSTCSATSVPP